MKKWLPSLAGGLAGLAVGLFYLFQPISSTPGIILSPVESLSIWMRRVFMPDSDPMAAFLFQIPLIVILPTVAGGLTGLLLQIVRQIVSQKPRK